MGDLKPTAFVVREGQRVFYIGGHSSDEITAFAESLVKRIRAESKAK